MPTTATTSATTTMPAIAETKARAGTTTIPGTSQEQEDQQQ